MTTLQYTVTCMECGPLDFTGNADKAAEKHCHATQHPVYWRAVPSVGQKPGQPDRDDGDGDHPHGDTHPDQDGPDAPS